jgi:hypothetical protein
MLVETDTPDVSSLRDLIADVIARP